MRVERAEEGIRRRQEKEISRKAAVRKLRLPLDDVAAVTGVPLEHVLAGAE